MTPFLEQLAEAEQQISLVEKLVFSRLSALASQHDDICGRLQSAGYPLPEQLQRVVNPEVWASDLVNLARNCSIAPGAHIRSNRHKPLTTLVEAVLKVDPTALELSEQ